ncbi:MAG: response regulator transcription factor [Gaiellaceae bacterium]
MPPTSGPALVVEDDASLRAYLVSELEHMGYRVVAAASGEEALGLMKREHASLAVLDIGLPGMDGFGVADALGDDVPVIIVTGDPVAAYAKAYGRTMNYRVLPKPIPPELFEHAVRESDPAAAV